MLACCLCSCDVCQLLENNLQDVAQHTDTSESYQRLWIHQSPIRGSGYIRVLSTTLDTPESYPWLWIQQSPIHGSGIHQSPIRGSGYIRVLSTALVYTSVLSTALLYTAVVSHSKMKLVSHNNEAALALNEQQAYC